MAKLDQDIIKKVNTFAEATKKIINYKMIILYGSYAKGMARDDSDIDVAVVVDELSDDYLDISSRLFSLVWDIDTRIEPVLLSAKEDKSGFLDSIMQYGYRVA